MKKADDFFDEDEVVADFGLEYLKIDDVNDDSFVDLESNP